MFGFANLHQGMATSEDKEKSWLLMAWSNLVEAMLSAKGASEWETIAWNEFDFSCIQIILNKLTFSITLVLY